MVRIVHVLNGAATPADGASVSAARICRALDALGAEVWLASLEAPGSAESSGFFRTFPTSHAFRPIGSSPPMRRWLVSEAARGAAPIFHVHGLWRMPGLYASNAALAAGGRMIVSPHGALAPCSLSIRRYRKNVFWAFFQRAALRAATCFHATCVAEYEDIRRAGFTQPVCLLPHGVDLPEPQTLARARRQVLFLGRVHEQKGMGTLLRAWKAVEGSFEDWDLEIVGRDERNAFAGMARRLGVQRAFFRGPLYGIEKTKALQRADLFVMPSESENFGLAVAESLAAGTPVIVTRGTPWACVEAREAGWWIELGASSLETALRAALSRSPPELAKMGERGRDWMRASFSWDEIGAKWAQTYRWLARPDVERLPPWVRTA